MKTKKKESKKPAIADVRSVVRRTANLNKYNKENSMIHNEKEIKKAAQDYIDIEIKPRDEEENRKCVECYSVGFWLAADIKDVDRDDDVKQLYLKELYEHFKFENKEQSFTSMIEWLLNQLWIRDRRDFKLDLLGKEVAEESGTNDDE